MMTKRFWMDALERMLKTAAQVAIPMFTATSLDKIDWQWAGLTVASAAILSLLFSIVSSRVGSPADASLVNQEPVTPPTTLHTAPAEGVKP